MCTKALIDMNSDIKFTQSEFHTLDNFQKSLNIIKVTVEALCRRDATLLTADAAMKFMLRRLLARSLRVRISQRRLSIASTLQYLQNPETYFSEVATAELPKTPEMVEEIYSLTQNFEDEPVVRVMDDLALDNSASSVSGDSESVDFVKELNKEIEKSLKEKNRNMRNRNETEDEPNRECGYGENDKHKLIQIEMALFENGGNRGFYLDMAYRHLLTVPPTSVESEKAFSSAACTCNKIRSSLKDNTLDALCYLRSIFQQSRSREFP
ncbi:unnamed protein product [Parnassius apollo]|uniref:(apollo) hypothetical protein n=1 Tax=Parnassius apollo TaxID=110799 RepID=A0A8S3XGN5_PARAO|nr:unnamed protein product [Parnassius apollo]